MYLSKLCVHTWLDSDYRDRPAGIPEGRPSLLAAATARRRLGGPALATQTLMTPHCSQTKADAKGKRRRGETKAWHAQRWAPPPRRRRRQGHQRERLDQWGGWGERRVPPVAQYMNRRAHLHAKQAKPQRLGESSSPTRTGTYSDGSFSRKDKRVTKTDDCSR